VGKLRGVGYGEIGFYTVNHFFKIYKEFLVKESRLLFYVVSNIRKCKKYFL
jgi:hypothetical protein